MTLTNEEFIRRSKNIHGNKFDYSKTYYEKSSKKVTIICMKCGNEFNILPHNHFKCDCKKCVYKKLPQNQAMSHDAFLQRAIILYGNKYEYLTRYVHSQDKILIKCLKCGDIFEQIAYSHLEGHGCKKCADIRSRENQLLPIYEFENRAKSIHKSKYTYIQDYNGCNNKVSIICPIHGKFRQEANSHLRGQGCPRCDSSKGEIKIEFFLNKFFINYEKEKRFNDCKGQKYPLPFDFYIPSYNMCIEYDGIQHFYPISAFGGKKSFLRNKCHDKIKNEYCKNKHIILIRIPFYDINNIESILKKALCFP